VGPILAKNGPTKNKTTLSLDVIRLLLAVGVELKRLRRNNQAESSTPWAGGFEAYAYMPEPEQSIEVVCIDRPTIEPGYRVDRVFTTKPLFFA
jgi:hypothetical protein